MTRMHPMTVQCPQTIGVGEGYGHECACRAHGVCGVKRLGCMKRRGCAKLNELFFGAASLQPIGHITFFC